MARGSERQTWREWIGLEGGSPGKTAKPLSAGFMGVLQIAQEWNIAGDLPDVSNVFAGSGMPATVRLLCMGLFSIF
jgi:hypothetical protein